MNDNSLEKMYVLHVYPHKMVITGTIPCLDLERLLSFRDSHFTHIRCGSEEDVEEDVVMVLMDNNYFKKQ